MNTVDHLGSVTYKVNDLLDEKVHEVSGTEFLVSCIEQVCLDFSSVGAVMNMMRDCAELEQQDRYNWKVNVKKLSFN